MAAESEAEYLKWTKDSLVKRVQWLEAQLMKQPSTAPATASASATTGASKPAARPPLPSDNWKLKKKSKADKMLDPSKYSTRLVAIKLSYLGKSYNGFEFQTSASVPSIEEELWKAMVKSCLISPENPDKVDFAPFEYSKCGRTDRGVSAFGQVISIRLRSSRPLPETEQDELVVAEPGPDGKGAAAGDAEIVDAAAAAAGESGVPPSEEAVVVPKPEWDPIADEIQYCKVLNRLLPPDIRALAWAPTLPEDFSARFSCRERQYRYYFTQPCYLPTPCDPKAVPGPPKTAMKDGWLDIEAMRAAARKFEGLHDFRNFCKVDAGKQITNFMRRVFEADIVEVPDVGSALPFLDQRGFKPDVLRGGGDNVTGNVVYPKVYYFHVRASAFLWHQIRHMVAIVFCVGQGLESPSVVSDLLDVQKNLRRPDYVLADEVPLVLWDCVFPNLDHVVADQTEFTDSVGWVRLGEDNPYDPPASGGLVGHLWSDWREKKLDELLANRLLECVAGKYDVSKLLEGTPVKASTSQKIFAGGNKGNPCGSYLPVLKRPLMLAVEDINDKWAQSKGFTNSEELLKTTNWRTAIREAKRTGSIWSGSDARSR
ncbi:pseudouridine synthase [Lasiosphaeria miniovina]|uniref:Pseudouridine synthase n=1 Tax=Lasiosphaeria miniovina TaxID=1954250 RepID=A0AA39ZZV4_9PEZI|nr:pseudouridine synthase [Lasiosphaeria miniovina]KAK0706449.1 pseudouridine synthase [Lasiosphaeria miniovina]